MKYLIAVFGFILFSNISFAQPGADRSFSKMLQSYYRNNDADLIEKTVDFANHAEMSFNGMQMILTGFFGALFEADPGIKKDIEKNILLFQKPAIQNLMTNLLSSNIDSIYAHTKITASYNDMNWASFFATGNTKYLDNIISHLQEKDNRIDLSLFLTGYTGMWSLSSNARQDLKVKTYLQSLEKKNALIKEVLEKEPSAFKTEMVEILKMQKEAGIWK